MRARERENVHIYPHTRNALSASDGTKITCCQRRNVKGKEFIFVFTLLLLLLLLDIVLSRNRGR